VVEVPAAAEPVLAKAEPAIAREALEASEADSLDESAPLPPPPPLVGVTCPNCGEELASRPLGQSPCPHCRRVIHVRARQGVFRSGLVGEDDVDAIDFLETVEPFGISEADCRRLLREAPGRNLVEVLGDLCEARVAALPEGKRSRLLEEMAMFRKFRGEEYLSLRRRAAASSLGKLRQEGVARVSIGARGGECCAACAPALGQVLGVAEAEAQALLPAPVCTRPDGLCRCTYLPA
jgi:hypothetical protein